jgi:site-specific recombinase XerD
LAGKKTFSDDVVNWEDPTLKRWLGTITRAKTKRNYMSVFRAYTQYTKQTATTLIDEAIEDHKKDPREKQDIMLQRLLGFYKWLKTEYPKKSRGKGVHKIVGKGVSEKVANTYVNSIRSFYATFGVTVRLKGRHRLPKPRVKNKRMIVDNTQVRKLFDHARTPRDRAIILTMFQGGMDVSTLCSLTYDDVQEGLTKNEHPLKLDLHRPKTGVEYYTFLGRDAVNALKAYMKDAEARGVKFNHGTSLFLKEKGKSPLKTNNVQNMMKIVAQKAGFVDGDNNGKAFNPLSPHALRESFGSIMTNAGVPRTIVDFWLGHEIGEMAEAYQAVQFESLKKMYLEREKLISISTQKVDVEELEAKLRAEVEQGNRQLQVMVNNLVTENMDLKNRIRLTEQKLTELEKLIREALEE